LPRIRETLETAGLPPTDTRYALKWDGDEGIGPPVSAGISSGPGAPALAARRTGAASAGR
jgi:hypothetical protein